MYTAGPTVNNFSALTHSPEDAMDIDTGTDTAYREVRSEDDIRAEVRRQASEGFDIIKVYLGIEPLKEPGWTRVHSAKPEGKKRSTATDDSDDEKAQKLPPLEKGERCKKSSQSLETRVTKPPKPHTDASLLDAMKKAGASIDDEDLAATMKRCGLGTPATRAAIIERLLKTGYIERSKKELLPTGKGIDLVAQVEEELRDPALTAQWEQRLKDIEEGKLAAEAFEADIVTHLKSLLPKVFAAAPLTGAQAVGFGTCPLCQEGSVRETPKAYGCSRWREGCSFTIWKRIAGKTITSTQACQLLARKKTRKLKGFKSKKSHRRVGRDMASTVALASKATSFPVRAPMP